MDFHSLASIVSSLMFVFASTMYVRSVSRGQVRVSVSTFSILAMTSVSQAIALLSAGSFYASVFMAMTAVVNSLVVYYGVRRKIFELKTLDLVSFVAAIAGLVAWYFTKDPSLNVYILTGAILISFVPLIRKTFRNPETESTLPWMLMLAASIVFALTITSPNPIHWIVQARQLLLTVMMSVALSQKYTK